MSQDVSQTPNSGALYRYAPQSSQMSSEVNVGASTSSGEEFLGFPVTIDQYVAVGRSLGAAFDFDEADGTPVTEALAQKIRVYLRMIPDDKKARMLADPTLKN